jgi:hypothetical protein
MDSNFKIVLYPNRINLPGYNIAEHTFDLFVSDVYVTQIVSFDVGKLFGFTKSKISKSACWYV